ncbi:MAG: glycosyltransferase family 4 protein [Deltaproteobacteria bacterium]|nr:glycosyltransferase family 4 protein [Deltaproteobacteria bacterium]
MSPNKLRIAMISPTLGSAFGLEQVLMTSVKGLRDRGHEVFLIGEKAFDSLPKTEFPTLIPGLFSTPALLKPVQLKRVKQEFLKVLGTLNPDILHFLDQPHADLIDLATSLYSCVLTAHTVAPTCPASHRLANDSQVCDHKSGWSCLLQNKTFHCLNTFKTDLHRSHVLYEFESKRRATKKMKAIIAISRYVESKLLENGFSKSQVKLIYNPLPQWDFVERIEVKTPLLVSACRLVPLKGLEFAIRALKVIESLDWEYWILGEGPLSEPLKSLVKSLKLEHKIIFKGKTPREKTLEILNSATLLLQTNVGPEGFGLSVAEALSLGTPAIAFDTPALNEIIEHGKNGFLVKPKDIASLSQTIQALLQSPALRAELSRYGREKTLKTFSEHTFIDSTLQLYTQII